MKKHKIHVSIVSWENSEILIPCVKSFLESRKEDSVVSVVLNGYDKNSCEYLGDNKIKFIILDKNRGQSAVDYGNSLYNSEYMFFPNDDMIFPLSWEQSCLSNVPNNSKDNFSLSFPLLEPGHWGHPMTQKAAFSAPFSEIQSFLWASDNSGYGFKRRISWSHPIFLSRKNWLAVGGYGDNFNPDFGPGCFTDDYFAYRLWRLYDKEFDFIGLDSNPFYHLGSYTMNKIPSRVEIKPEVFKKNAGIDIDEFKKIAQQYKELN